VIEDLQYGDASLGKRLYMAHAIVTAPVIYSTAAGTGGPLLWNGSKTVLARIVGVGWGITTASGAAGALGITGATGQTAAPSSTTAIDSTTNLYIGAPVSSCTPYRIGTPTNAGTFFFPFASIGTTAVTAEPPQASWIRLDRMITVAPGSWASVSASATLTSAVMQISLVWEEIPLS
jgi:hypothetical protein